MLIAMIARHSRICGKLQGFLGLPVRDIIVTDKVCGEETPAMETAWTPTPDELERLNKGANVIARILGTVPPPMLLMVDNELPKQDGPACTLYRYQYVSEMGGYCVYRAENPFDPIATTRLAWIAVHKTAVFVAETEAKHYCGIRNQMVERYGDDALPTD